MAKILIVDDEKGIRKTLGEFLRNDGHDVEEAEDAEIALQVIKARAVDVVVTDIVLPRLTGIELLRRIHAIAPEVQVVMMTGEPTLETAAESLRLGAANYLFKPITKAEILRAATNAEKLKSLHDTRKRLEAENRAHQENLERLIEERTRQLVASEARAQESSGFNQAALDALTAHICILAEDGSILMLNQAWSDSDATDTPLRIKAGVGANYFQLWEVSDGMASQAEQVIRGLRAVAAGQLPEFSLEYSCHSPKVQRWFGLRATRFAGAQPVRIVVAHENITERKREETIREALLSLGNGLGSATSAAEVARSIFAAADKLWQWDAGALDLAWAGTELAQSVLCLDIVEGKRREVTPTRARGVPTPRMRRIMMCGAELISRKSKESPTTDCIPFGDGDRLSESIMCVPISRRGTPIGVLSIQSYTADVFTPEDLQRLQVLADYCGAALERIHTDEQLRKLARAVEQCPVSIVITDSRGSIEFVNPKFTRVTGYTSAEAMGKNPRILKSDAVPTEDYRQLWETITAGKEWRGEFHNKRKDGTLYWEAASISAIRDASGAITHFVAVKEDITEKKQMEANFLRAQRLEGIGALASGIAHDLNNILAPVLMLGPLLRDNVVDPDSRSMLETIEGCAKRGADIIKQLLTFARGTTGTRVPLPAGHILREMVKIIRETFPRDIEPKMESPKNLWLLLGDATQVHQAMMNLCVNARDAMPDGGTLTLSARNINVNEELAARTPEARPGPYVCLMVSDTGTGIAPENLGRIFDPFFTTKEIGSGTGLGLATVMGIARGHQGFVQVASQWGKGTTFELYFPAAPQPENVAFPKLPMPPPNGQGELILVVDDERSVCESVRRTLEAHGYQVLSAAQGGEALTVYGERRAKIRAVITDMMMPVMSGPTLIVALKRLNPQLIILGMTGLPEQTNVKGLDRLALSGLLVKPFRGEDLLYALNQALRPGGAAPPTTAEE